MTELYSTKGDYGFRTLYEPDNAIVDIVFVHGLTGNRETTWTYKHKSSKVFWPEALLANDLETARILTFGYDADVVGVLETAGSNTLRDHGNSLANDLARRRVRSKSNDRPIIFVAHSIGGLVVEQALLIARGAAQQHLKLILESTTAIAFLGTPHCGANKAEWAGLLTRLSNVLRKTNRNIVKVLEPGSEMLANLQQEFHTMLDDRTKNQLKTMEIYCFYEEKSVVGIGKIVPDYSAILPGYQKSCIHDNHMDMTKFKSANDPGYDAVSGQLWLWTDAIEKRMETHNAEPPSRKEIRDLRRDKSYGTMQDILSPMYSGSVNAGRSSFQGNAHVGGDFSM